MATIEVSLYDPETDTSVLVRLSPEDAARAGNDIPFVTALMNAAIQEQSTFQVAFDSEPSASSSNVDTQADCSGEKNLDSHESDTSKNDEGSCYRWTAPNIKLLLETYSKNEKKFESGKQTHKKIWVEIANILSSNGLNVTGDQCAAKLRSLKKTYKSVKDHNNKSGNDRRPWEFYEIMDNIFSKKAWISPVAIASSSGLTDHTTSANSDSGNGCELPPKNKMTSAILLRKRLLQKEEHENAKAKRHKEKMEIDARLLAVLEKLANK